MAPSLYETVERALENAMVDGWKELAQVAL